MTSTSWPYPDGTFTFKQEERMKRDPAWWGTFAFYEGILEGFAEDLPILDMKNRDDVLTSIRRCKGLLSRIEDSVVAQDDRPPF